MLSELVLEPEPLVEFCATAKPAMKAARSSLNDNMVDLTIKSSGIVLELA